jgi:hypothetical protein
MGKGLDADMDVSQGLTDLSGALGALQSASNIIKTLAGLRSESERSAKLIELQSQIMTAQTSAIQANTAQTTLVDRVRQLEAEIARLETWSTEKQRYELKSLRPGSFAMALKADAQGSEPIHYLCQACYEGEKKFVLQLKPSIGLKRELGVPDIYFCPGCHTEIVWGSGS